MTRKPTRRLLGSREPLTERLNLSLTPSDFREMQALARRAGVTVAELARACIEQGLPHIRRSIEEDRGADDG